MILIPAHNEAASIASVLRDVCSYMPDSEIVVVANCCQDATAELAHHYGATVLYEDQPGYVSALRCGYKYALQQQKKWVVQLDGDGQHPAFYIPLLVSKMKTTKVDWLMISRHKTGCGGPLLRRIGSSVVGSCARVLGAHGLYDISSGFWGLKPEIIRFLVEKCPPVFDANIRLLASHAGFCLQEISLPMEERYTGESMHHGWASIQNGIRSLLSLVQAYRDASQCR